ncbi:MAG: hypothetical protein ACFB2Z_12480 [Maricaulaceae bacterium]
MFNKMILLGLAVGVQTSLAHADIAYHYATADEAAAILTADDPYTLGLQPKEIGVQMQDAAKTTRADLNARYRRFAADWDARQTATMDQVIADLQPVLSFLESALPERVALIKIDGQFIPPHTRANAIVFPTEVLGAPEEALKDLFVHELHHVLSRHNPALRDDLYAQVGFEPCAFEPPSAVTEDRLSNPDAPVYRHFAPIAEGALDVDGADGLIPYLSITGPYDGEQGGALGNYFKLDLLPVTVSDGVCTVVTEETGAVVRLPGDTEAFYDVIGRNTQYVIHPEEIAAVNFTLAMNALWNAPADLPNPEIAERVLSFWREVAQQATAP